MSTPPDLIMASTSISRATLLNNAVVPFTTQPPGVDEEMVKASLAAENAEPAHVAEMLAEMKAVAISRRQPRALVLGADQILVCEDTMHDKPADMAAAAEQLKTLRGKPHMLVTAAVIAEEGAAVWRQIARATLIMRNFSDAFLETYLEQAGEDILSSVGGYRLEGPGLQLFSAIAGDHSVILGLPMLPLTEYLRTRGVLVP